LTDLKQVAENPRPAIRGHGKDAHWRRRSAPAAAVCLALFLLAPTGGVHAQTGLGTQIRELEQRLASPTLAPAERHAALVSLARLRQLSGNVATAADLWLQAAALNPADTASLVSGAYCLAAIGEWERALAVVRPVLDSGGTGAAVVRARFLDSALRAWTTGDYSGLLFLIADPDPAAAALRPTVYYTLWWSESRNPAAAAAAGIWLDRLVSSYPASPEARIAAESPGVAAAQSPLWLLLPGIREAEAPSPPIPGSPPTIPSPPPPIPIPPIHEPMPIPGLQSLTEFTQGQQTGLFRNESNAMAFAESLMRAGFQVLVIRRMQGGEEMWAVVVPTDDAAGTARDLRNAGHDSFTVGID